MVVYGNLCHRRTADKLPRNVMATGELVRKRGLLILETLFVTPPRPTGIRGRH